MAGIAGLNLGSLQKVAGEETPSPIQIDPEENLPPELPREEIPQDEPEMITPEPAAPEPVQVVEEVIPDTEEFYFTCFPILTFRLGDYEFEDGLLKLVGAEARSEFKKFLGKFPVVEQSRVKELDRRAAETISQQYIAAHSNVTQGIDSSTGERANPNLIGKNTILEDSGIGVLDSLLNS